MKKYILYNSLSIFLLFLTYVNSSFSQMQPILNWYVNTDGNGITVLTFSPDGSKVALAGGWLHLYDAHTGKISTQFPESKIGTSISSIAFSPDGKYIVTGRSHVLAEIWDVETGKKVQSLQGDDPFGPEWYSAVSFSPDQTKIVAAYPGAIHVFDRITGLQIKRIANSSGFIYSFIFYPDGNRLFSRGAIFSILDGNTLYQLPAGEGSMFFVPSKMELYHFKDISSNYSKGKFMILDANTFEKKRELPEFTYNCQNIKVSHNGLFYLLGGNENGNTCATEKRIRIISTEESKELISFFPEGKENVEANLTAISPDDTKAAIVYGETVYIYDISDLTAGIPDAPEHK